MQAAFDFDELEVYADHLQAEGDPRGELVSLDLQPQPTDRAWWLHRRGAAEAWLGPAHPFAHLVQHGFIHELRDGATPRALLDGPLGDVVRGYTTWGHGRVFDSIRRLATRPRPWLVRLAIAYWSKRRLSNADRDALIAATPNLRELVLVGDPVVTAFPHPNVRSLVIEDRTLPQLVGFRGLPARRAVDGMGLHPDVAVTVVQVPTGRAGPLLTRERFVELRTAVEATPDVRALAAHATRFPEPMPALLARYAASGLLELEGPVVRVAQVSTRNPPWLGFGPPARSFVVEGGGHRVAIRAVRNHVELLTARMTQYSLTETARDTLSAYSRQLYMTSLRALTGATLTALASALWNLLELRGMTGDDLGNPNGWVELEQLATLLANTSSATVTWA